MSKKNRLALFFGLALILFSCIPREVMEEKIELDAIATCEVGPYSTLYLMDFGVRVSHPANWFIKLYEPNERIGTGDPGPEYLAVISNIEENFDPNYSKGTGQYNSETGVVQIFITRWEKDDPNQSALEEEGIHLSQRPDIQIVQGGSGFRSMKDSLPEDSWYTFYQDLDLGKYVLTAEARLWKAKDEVYVHCFDTTLVIFTSISPFNTPNSE